MNVHRSKRVDRQAMVVLGLGLVVAPLGGATAQEGDVPGEGVGVPQTNLIDIGGLNAAQDPVADAIGRTCRPQNGLAPVPRDETGAPIGTLSAAQDLAFVCTEVVVTANEEIGDADAADVEASEALAGALQQVAGEEFQTGQSQIAELRSDAVAAIGNRMAALRSGAVGGTLASAHPAVRPGAEDDAGWTMSGKISDVFLGRFGVFFSAGAEFGSKDATAEADGFEFTSPSVTVGADYRVTDSVVVGAAFTYDRIDVDFDTTTDSAAGQELDTDGFLFSVYATASITDALFVEGIVSGGFANHASTRRITSDVRFFTDDRSALADFGSTQFGFVLGGGYDIAIDAVTVTPLAQVEYVHADIDGVTETGASGLNLTISDQDVDSFTTQIGAQASVAVSTGVGVLSPFVRGQYVREFLNDNDGALVSFANEVALSPGLTAPRSQFGLATEEVDRDYGRLTAGVTATLPNGIVGFVEGGAIVGLGDFDIFDVSAGLRLTF